MQLQQPFDARNVEPSQNMQPVPPGEYKVRAIESEAVPTADGQSGMLVFKLEILEGQFAGRTLQYRLNLFNKSQQATEIAYKQLSALCHVTGVFQLQASEQLHGIAFIVIVTINTAGYNDVKGVKDINGNAPGKQGQQGSFPPSQPQQPAPAAAPAWGGQPAAPPAAAPPAAWGQPPAASAPPQQPATTPWGPPQPTAAPQQPAPPVQTAAAWSPNTQAAPAATPPWGGGAPATPPWGNK